MTYRRALVLVGGLAAVLTFVVFRATLSYEFVNWDDNAYVYRNPYLQPVTAEHVLHFFTHPYFRSWTPVAFLSHALDVRIWQFNPFGHHLTNVLLHSVNTALVFWLALLVLGVFRNSVAEKAVLSSSVISGSVIAALVFALHPLRAESVAWISDRKDLLSACFMLLTCIVYIRRRTSADSSRALYVLLVVLYALALGAKSIAMVLPVAFILFDRVVFRQRPRRIIADMAPLFLLALGTGIMAKLAAPSLEKDFVVGEKTAMQMFAFPFTATLFYVRKLVFPADLSPVYHTNAFLPSSESPMLYVAPVIILAVTAACIVEWRRGRQYVLLAWGIFILFLVPTFLGLLSGIQPVADRYTYFASVPLCVAIGGGVERLFRPLGRDLFSMGSRIVLAVCVTVLSLLAYRTMQQIRVWKDPMTLWTYVIPRAPFPLAYNNYGMALTDKRMYQEAIASYQKALQLRPAYAEALCNLGIAYNRAGEREKAIASYQRVVQVEPDYLDAYINLGTEYLDKGLVDEAIATYRTSLKFDSAFAPAYYNVGLAMMKRNDYPAAAEELRGAVRLDPSSADAWYNLGVAYDHQSRFADAAMAYEKAIGLRKDYLDAYINLGNSFVARGESAKALGIFGKAILINPKSADAFYNLGYVLYSVGEVDRACDAFELAIRYDSTYAKAYHNLGVILERRGDERRAIAYLAGAARLGYADSQDLLRRKGLRW